MGFPRFWFSSGCSPTRSIQRWLRVECGSDVEEAHANRAITLMVRRSIVGLRVLKLRSNARTSSVSIVIVVDHHQLDATHGMPPAMAISESSAPRLRERPERALWLRLGFLSCDGFENSRPRRGVVCWKERAQFKAASRSRRARYRGRYGSTYWR